MKITAPDDFTLTEESIKLETTRIHDNVFRSSKHSEGFKNKYNLATWWIEQIHKQKGRCAYCKTSIILIEQLINSNLLKGRPTRGGGIRGKYFELERRNPSVGYQIENCVLICYYCNNDKSSIYSADEYEEFLAPAKYQHFLSLSKKLPQKV